MCIYLNSKVPKYIKLKPIALKGEIDKSTIILGDFSVTVKIINRTRRQLDLINIYTTVHPAAAEIHTLSKCTWNSQQDKLYSEP